MVKVSDLKNQTGEPGPHSFLYCQNCGDKASANKGDYWNEDPNYIFQCCNENMLRVIERNFLEEV